LVALIAFCLNVFYQTHIEPNIVPRIDIKRIVYVKVIVDKAFRDYPGWERLIQDLIKESSYHFDCQLGIEIAFKRIGDIETMSAKDTQSSTINVVHRLWQRACNIVNAETDLDWIAEHVDPEDCDIIVYFAGKSYGMYRGCVNDIFGNCALIAYNSRENSFQKMLRVFIHEIGHLFGAMHTNRKSSVMYPSPVKSLKFDEINKKIILKNKWRNFQQQPEEN